MLEILTPPNTFISRWGTKPKFIAFILLAFSFACVKSLALLPLVLLITGLLFYLSRVPLPFLLQRLKIPAGFIVIMGMVLLFFTQGQAIAQLGPLTVTREGAAAALLMIVRCVSILTLMIILFSTSSFLEVMAAMQSLGIPEILTDMLIFTHRYLHETAIMFNQMNTAMALRGFSGQRLKAFYTYSYLAGTIFIRSYEQSERIYQAMIMRGYGQHPAQKTLRESSPADQALCAMCVIISLTLVSAQFYLFPGV